MVNRLQTRLEKGTFFLKEHFTGELIVKTLPGKVMPKE